MSEGGSGTAGYEDEISLLEVASMVLRRRQVIVVSTFVCTMLALVFALQTPFQYTATLSFQPYNEARYPVMTMKADTPPDTASA